MKSWNKFAKIKNLRSRLVDAVYLITSAFTTRELQELKFSGTKFDFSIESQLIIPKAQGDFSIFNSNQIILFDETLNQMSILKKKR